MQANTTDGDGLERWPDAASAANIGIMLFRVSARKLAEVRPKFGPSNVYVGSFAAMSTVCLVSATLSLPMSMYA